MRAPAAVAAAVMRAPAAVALHVLSLFFGLQVLHSNPRNSPAAVAAAVMRAPAAVAAACS
jgi:hypothetical protein